MNQTSGNQLGVGPLVIGNNVGCSGGEIQDAAGNTLLKIEATKDGKFVVTGKLYDSAGDLVAEITTKDGIMQHKGTHGVG